MLPFTDGSTWHHLSEHRKIYSKNRLNPKPSVLLNMYLTDANTLWLTLGSSQNFSRKPTADRCAYSCFSQLKRRQTWSAAQRVSFMCHSYRAPGGFFTGLEKARQKKKKSPKLIHTPFPSPFSSFPQQEWSFSVFNRGEVILELQHIPLSYTNCVFWLCPNHITPPFSPSFFLNILRLLKTLNWQLGNGEQRKLKGIFGTPDYAEGT